MSYNIIKPYSQLAHLYYALILEFREEKQKKYAKEKEDLQRQSDDKKRQEQEQEQKRLQAEGVQKWLVLQAFLKTHALFEFIPLSFKVL